MFRADDVNEILVPFLDLSVKVTALLALAAIAALLARRASAATRHLLFLGALIATLALPVIEWVIPARWGATWTLALPRQWMQTHVPAAAMPSVVPSALSTPAPNEATVGKVAPETNTPLSPTNPAPTVAPTLAPVATAQPDAGISLSGVTTAVYGLGFVFVLAQVAIGGWAVRRLARGSRAVSLDAPLRASVPAALADAGATSCGPAITLRLAPNAVPMTWGWRRPTILLPDDAETWDAERLRVVLLHEIAHIVRRDWPIQMFAYLVCAAYWFHPLVWWAAARLRAESERACDDRVLLAGVASDAYAAQLLEIAKGTRARQDSGNSAVRFASSMARSRGLEERLRAIFANPVRRTRRLGRRQVVAIAGTLAAAALSVSLFHLTSHAEDGVASSPSSQPLRKSASESASGKNPPPGSDPSLAFYRIPQNKQWTRDAGSGTTIELVGLSHCANLQHPSRVSQSWKPDGARFQQALYASAPQLADDAVVRQHSVEFAFRLHNTTGKTVTIRSIPTANPISYDSSASTPFFAGYEGQADPFYYRESGGLRPIVAAFQPKTRVTDLRIGVAAGLWLTQASLDLDMLRRENVELSAAAILETTFSRGGEVSFGAPIHDTKGLQHQPRYGFVITDSLRQLDSQIVAIDAAGVAHRPDDISINESANDADHTFRQTTVWFEEDRLPLAKLKELRFNTRPFRWMEFRNVSLYPKENAR